MNNDRHSRITGNCDPHEAEPTMKATSARKRSVVGSPRLVVIGCSAGGFDALSAILTLLPCDYLLPILVVQHLYVDDGGAFADHLARECCLKVVEPCDKDRIEPGCVHVAPANYHMLVERDGTIALSVNEKVNWSRPSIDVLFESAANAFGEGVIAVILTGASSDGARGIQAICEAGGHTIAQDPSSSEVPFMPQSAIASGGVKEVLELREIGRRLMELGAETVATAWGGE